MAEDNFWYCIKYGMNVTTVSTCYESGCTSADVSKCPYIPKDSVTVDMGQDRSCDNCGFIEGGIQCKECNRNKIYHDNWTKRPDGSPRLTAHTCVFVPNGEGSRFCPMCGKEG
jgi:hypothetical protein